MIQCRLVKQNKNLKQVQVDSDSVSEVLCRDAVIPKFFRNLFLTKRHCYIIYNSEKIRGICEQK